MPIVDSDEEIRRLLEETRAIAVVGASRDPGKEAHQIPLRLMQVGYRIIPVNPFAEEIFGRPAYPDLLAVREEFEVVQIFRPARYVPPIVEQAIAKRAKAVWMQSGIVSPAGAERASQAGLRVVMDRCMMVEYSRLLGWRRTGREQG